MNCKPGDIALCVAGPFSGAVCEVVSDGGSGFHIASMTWMLGWLVEFPRPMAWGVKGFGTDYEGWYPDAWLKPLGHDVLGDNQVKERETCPS